MQVAINWTICKGALPIPGAKNARQAKEAAGAALAALLRANAHMCPRTKRCMVHARSCEHCIVIENAHLCDAGGFGWRLTSDDMAALDAESGKIQHITGAPFENW